MKKFFGQLLVIIGSFSLIIISIVEAIYFFTLIFNENLLNKIAKDEYLVYIGFFIFFLLIVYSIFYNILTFIYIKKRLSTKKPLRYSLFYLLVLTILILYIFLIFKINQYLTSFIIFMSLNFFFFIIQLIGNIINYKK